MNNYGCLNSYVNILNVLDKNWIHSLIEWSQSTKGYLCNFQIPLVALIGNKNEKIVEIGCWHGRATKTFSIFPSETRKLWCVDTFLGSEEHQNETNGVSFKNLFLENTKDIKNLTVIENYSKDASRDFPNEFFDVVWIDASHDYENVVLDIASWYPKLKKGGMMVGHDYPEPLDPNGGFEELKKAVDEKVRDSKDFYNFGWVCGIWGAIKI